MVQTSKIVTIYFNINFLCLLFRLTCQAEKDDEEEEEEEKEEEEEEDWLDAHFNKKKAEGYGNLSDSDDYDHKWEEKDEEEEEPVEAY